MSANPTGHPARFSQTIVKQIIEILDPMVIGDTPWHLHDPFGGTGERLHDIAIATRCWYSGTEIEPEWIVFPNIVEGDATDPDTYPTVRPYAIVTSPTYPNGMADSWQASDTSKRNTYRHRLRDLNGSDRELHPNNQARWGYRGRGERSLFRQTYWDIADRAVANWDSAELALVNVSDFVYTKNGEERVEPVVDDWARLLAKHGWSDQTRIPVGTPRLGHGVNRDKRVDNEEIILARRRPR